MLDGIAYGPAECEEDDHPDNPRAGAKDDITNGPPVLECAQHEDQLRNDVDKDREDGEEEVDDKEGNGVRGVEASDVFECGDGEEKAKSEEEKRGKSDHPQ